MSTPLHAKLSRLVRENAHTPILQNICLLLKKGERKFYRQTPMTLISFYVSSTIMIADMSKTN